MPRYFISLFNGEADAIDLEGRDLPDLESARRYALKAAGEVVAEEMAHGREKIRIVLVVENQGRERLLELPVTVRAG